MITVLVVLVIIGLVVVFSVQNAIPVATSFFLWKFEASLAIVVFLSVIAGIIIGAIISALFRVRLARRKQLSAKQEKEVRP